MDSIQNKLAKLNTLLQDLNKTSKDINEMIIAVKQGTKILESIEGITPFSDQGVIQETGNVTNTNTNIKPGLFKDEFGPNVEKKEIVITKEGTTTVGKYIFGAKAPSPSPELTTTTFPYDPPLYPLPKSNLTTCHINTRVNQNNYVTTDQLSEHVNYVIANQLQYHAERERDNNREQHMQSRFGKM